MFRIKLSINILPFSSIFKKNSAEIRKKSKKSPQKAAKAVPMSEWAPLPGEKSEMSPARFRTGGTAGCVVIVPGYCSGTEMQLAGYAIMFQPLTPLPMLTQWLVSWIPSL